MTDIPQCSQSSKGSEYITQSQEQRNMTSILNALGIHSVNLVEIRKSKGDIATLAQTVIVKVNEKLADALDIDSRVISSLQFQNHNETSKDLEELIKNLLTEYITLKNIVKKLEILAFLPESWKFKKFAEYFPISYHIYKKLNGLERNLGKSLSMNTHNYFQNLFADSEKNYFYVK